MPAGNPQLTAKQIQLLEELQRFGDEMSGQQLHRLLQETPYTMGLATVYRHLRQLQQLGMVRCRHLPTGEALYAPVDHDRHHLTCVDCGCTQALNHCPLHDMTIPDDQQQDFQLLFHTLEFFGLCSNCRKQQQLHDL
ncbi:MAG: transcriptional repressor [Prochlorococcus sp.]|nr:transcriptional repressor [Prochlorococcaceae cyanobacterium Fu_MAG_50]